MSSRHDDDGLEAVHVEENVPENNRAALFEYITFLVIGASYLWPWNCFLSASAYFRSRFDNHTFLIDNFSSFVMSVSTLTSTSLSLFLAYRQNDSYAKRLFIGEQIIGSVFLLLALSCAVGISPVVYFWSIQVCVFLSSVGTAFAQNGALALASDLGTGNVQAMMVGQAVAGVVPPCISFLSSLTGSESKASSLATSLYFLVSTAVCLSAYLLFKIVFAHDSDTKYTPVNKYLSSIPETPEDDLEPTHSASSRPQIHDNTTDSHIPLLVLLRKLIVPSFAIFTTFSVTLVYPVFANNIDSSTGIHMKLFIPLVYFVWNWGDLTGRLMCGYPRLVVVRPTLIIGYSIVRLLLVPLFLLCNIHGRGLIKSDVLYLLLQFIFGVTNGHLASSAFMSAGNYVDPAQREAAGGFMTSVLSTGLAVGSLLSFALVKLVEGY